MGSANLTQEQKDLILGTLLGDGSLEMRWKNPRLRIDHSIQQENYVFWKYKLLQNIATRAPHQISEKDKRSRKISKRWYFSTKAIPELNFYHQLFYQSRRKIIRENIIGHFKAPLSLAVWLMDDGYKRNDCNALRFSTDCFPYEEQLILQKCLDKNFGICSTIHKKGNAWNIYIPNAEMDKIKFILTPYIIPTMNYKLGLNQHPVTTF